jgi:guanylate kinase
VKDRPTNAPPVVLSAPSGVGKTTIARALVEQEDDFTFSVSATTRAPRGGEAHGVDYWFLTDTEFREWVKGGKLAEWAMVHGEYYGTPLQNLREAGESGRPPSTEVLFRRLSGRGTEEETSLRRRLTTALQELDAAERFDFFIVNDHLERTVLEVRTIVRAGGSRAPSTSGSLEQARSLKREIAALLERERLLD